MTSNEPPARRHGDGMVLPKSRQSTAGLSLIELMVAFVIFAGLMVILVGAVEPVSRTWVESERKVLTYQRARAAPLSC